MLRRIFTTLVGASLLLGATSAAHADSLLEQVFSALHQADPTMPDASQIKDIEGLISTCEKASAGADEVVACAEAASASDLGQDAGIPSWVPYAINIYFAVEKPDFWGLAEDADIVVACAVLQGSTGVDVCGAVKALIDAASAVGDAFIAGAKAVAQFFSDLGALAGKVGCALGLGGCDDSPTAPGASTYLDSRIFDGLVQRLLGVKPWLTFAGPAPNGQDAQVVVDGSQAGVDANGLRQGLVRFRSNVYKQWDLKINTEVVPKLAKAMAAQGYKPVSAQTLSHAAALGKQQAGNDTSISNLMKPGKDVCCGFASANGGQQIDDWIAEGRAVVTKSSVTNSGNLCNDFDAALGKKFAQEVDTKVSFAFADVENKGLCKDEGNSAYKCSTPDAEHACADFAQTSYWLKGQQVQCDRGYCIPGVDCATPPATAKQIYFVCDGVCKLYYIGTQPAKCKIPDQLPVPGMPGSKPSSGVSCPANLTGPGQNPAVNNQQK